MRTDSGDEGARITDFCRITPLNAPTPFHRGDVAPPWGLARKVAEVARGITHDCCSSLWGQSTPVSRQAPTADVRAEEQNLGVGPQAFAQGVSKVFTHGTPPVDGHAKENGGPIGRGLTPRVSCEHLPALDRLEALAGVDPGGAGDRDPRVWDSKMVTARSGRAITVPRDRDDRFTPELSPSLRAKAVEIRGP